MTETRPAPLTPPECDLTDFEFMPVMVRRLLKSETWSLGNGEERAAAIALWFESWHQVPAASLPSEDRMLKRLADSEKWSKVKAQALRGWVLCSDGRLYHPVVAEKALEAWIEKATPIRRSARKRPTTAWLAGRWTRMPSGAAAATAC